MNKGLAHVLLSRIGNLPFVDLYAGVVSIQEKADALNDELGKPNKVIIKRFPVACDVIADDDCVKNGDLVSLIPDSKRKGIIYFENNGIVSNGRRGPHQNYTSNLRLVCWLNTKYIDADSCHELSLPVMTEIINKLTAKPFFNQDGYQRVFVKVVDIPQNGKQLFAAYTYNESITQYLMPPFEHFAIDLQINYSISANCINNVKLKPDESC